jgi:hypothetical protein
MDKPKTLHPSGRPAASGRVEAPTQGAVQFFAAFQFGDRWQGGEITGQKWGLGVEK